MDWAEFLLWVTPDWVPSSWADLLLTAIPDWVAPISSWADVLITATPNFGVVVFPIMILLSSFILIIMMEEYDRGGKYNK